nr:hypothetical protein [Tanacetum cinerariifolium]
MKVLDNLTIHTPPSYLVASFHLRDLYCYYRPRIDDPKKHYAFKPSLLRHSGSLRVDFLNLEMIDDDWGLESKEIYFLGRELNLPIWPKEVEKAFSRLISRHAQSRRLGPFRNVEATPHALATPWRRKDAPFRALPVTGSGDS